MISLIVARADNGIIGSGGALPWRLPEDMRRFKALTMGKPVVMGRKTWDSLPKKPLPGRTNIVVTRKSDFAADGARIACGFEAALALAGDVPEIMVIGGAEIFAVALSLAKRVYLTEIHTDPAGDVRMAGFSPEHWIEISRENAVSSDGLAYSFVHLEGKLT